MLKGAFILAFIILSQSEMLLHKINLRCMLQSVLSPGRVYANFVRSISKTKIRVRAEIY